MNQVPRNPIVYRTNTVVLAERAQIVVHANVYHYAAAAYTKSHGKAAGADVLSARDPAHHNQIEIIWFLKIDGTYFMLPVARTICIAHLNTISFYLFHFSGCQMHKRTANSLPLIFSVGAHSLFIHIFILLDISGSSRRYV